MRLNGEQSEVYCSDFSSEKKTPITSCVSSRVSKEISSVSQTAHRFSKTPKFHYDFSSDSCFMP